MLFIDETELNCIHHSLPPSPPPSPSRPLSPGAFLIPYFIFLFGGGLPVFFLEVALGQFTSEGGITCWEKLCPIFTGTSLLFSPPGACFTDSSALVQLYVMTNGSFIRDAKCYTLFILEKPKKNITASYTHTHRLTLTHTAQDTPAHTHTHISHRPPRCSAGVQTVPNEWLLRQPHGNILEREQKR